MAPPITSIKVNANGIPDFEDLPLRKGDPHHSAWGLYGDQDELGFLNRLTNERVAAAAQNEIRTGQRISLNWPLDAQPRRSFFQRAKFHQDIFPKAPATVNDDVWTFNSQVSTQWDGLRHYGYQKEKVFYNGVTMKDIHGVDDKGNKATVNGIHAWANEGIVGRGVLIDYHSWRESQAEVKVFDSFDSCPIPLEDLKACLEAQGTEIKFADILFIRTGAYPVRVDDLISPSSPTFVGFMKSYANKTAEEIWSYQDVVPHKFGGVEQDENILRWIWENFSAVAGDHPTFECWPTQKDWLFHEVLLAGWGCPIGELFDLERLAEQCEKESRWSFFVSSEPCNVPGGVASPPNILAIF